MYTLKLFTRMELMMNIRAKKIFVDLICFTIILFLWLLIKCLCQPLRRGFWCDDHSIKYAHKESSNATLFLLIWSFILPAITIIVFETIRVRKMIVYVEKDERLFDWKYLCWKLYKKLSVFYMGAVSLVLITTIIKYTTGRLRPDFIDLCRPDVDCRRDENRMVFIENYTCANSYRLYEQISEARMSFLSGHSAYSAYCAVYFCVYLHMKMKSHLLMCLRAVLQLMALLAALYIGLNRMAINKHHWSDVLAGLLLGAVMALITNKYFLNDCRSDSGSLDLLQTHTNYNTNCKSETKISVIKTSDNSKDVSQC